MNDNEPAYIEALETCLKCGKKQLFSLERGSKLEDYISKYMLDRQE